MAEVLRVADPDDEVVEPPIQPPVQRGGSSSSGQQNPPPAPPLPPADTVREAPADARAGDPAVTDEKPGVTDSQTQVTVLTNTAVEFDEISGDLPSFPLRLGALSV